MKKYTLTIVTISFVVFMNLINAQTKVDYAEIAEKIHSEIITIDTHVDTPLRMVRGMDITKRNDGKKDGSKLDFPRMKEGKLDAVFFAVYVGQGKRDDEGNSKAYKRAIELFDVIDSVMSANKHVAEIALTPKDAVRIKSENKLAIYLGVENGYPLGKDISLIKKFYDMGARYITLSHTKNNDICDSSTDPEGPEHNGLSDFGKEVVKEMNKIGMIIDVSHISDKAIEDVLKFS
ncbi:MAG TPA: membrane dipeptidase, partial [Ignavibacteriaceae bacterium]|nr:membrane dipeptidase [Ignavibacteriaceae bacterium]